MLRREGPESRHTPTGNGDGTDGKESKGQLMHLSRNPATSLPADARDGLDVEVESLGRWYHDVSDGSSWDPGSKIAEREDPPSEEVVQVQPGETGEARAFSQRVRHDARKSN